MVQDFFVWFVYFVVIITKKPIRLHYLLFNSVSRAFQNLSAPFRGD